MMTLRQLPFLAQRRCMCTAREGMHADCCIYYRIVNAEC